MVDRFEISATSWARKVEKIESAYPLVKGSLDGEAKSGLDLEKEADALAYAGLRFLAGQRITSLWLELHVLRGLCQSPLELPMALALMVIARHEGIDVKILSAEEGDFGDPFEPLLGTSRFPKFFLTIEPQAQLGEHRVDFLLTLEGSAQTEKGRPRSAAKKMVIECDGHDFHERTKEQARRDRGRDRNLQSFGFLVYRYTGREIWSDVFSCAVQALTSLKQPVMAELYGGHRTAD